MGQDKTTVLAKRKEFNHTYYQGHKQYYREYHRKYFQEHKVQVSEQQQGYFRTPEGRLVRVSFCHRWRASLVACGINDLTKGQLFTLFAESTHCPVCGDAFDEKSSMKKKTLDHIVPLNKGGQHTLAQVQILCKSCNSRKEDRIISNEELAKEVALVL